MRKAVTHLKKVDPRLAEWIEKVGPFRLKPDAASSAYAAFAESIVYQQLSGKAAATIWKRFTGLYPGAREPDPKRVARTPLERLRGVGLSGSKAAAILDLSAKAAKGSLPEFPQIARATDEEILEAFTEVRGIGPWTVQMFLMFRLGRLDVLPSTDYGIQQGFKRVYGKRSLPKPKAILRHGEIWKPYRSIASWYLWRALEVKDGASDRD